MLLVIGDKQLSSWSLRPWLLLRHLGLAVPLTPEARADVARVDAIWSGCRAQYGGPWLFGERYTVADAMFAPVALRFRSYGADLSAGALGYFGHVLADAHLQEWIRGAEHELAAEGRPVEHP